MRVSFVIPTLNQGRFIGRCLDQCLAQEIEESEVIVADGVSSDGTLQVLERYGDRVKWSSCPDSGQSQAVNRAVAEARGEIIAWINSDDYYPSSRVLPEVLAVFDSDETVDIVYGDGLFVHPDGRPIRSYRSGPLRSPSEILIRPSSFVMQPAVFFRRALFQAVGGLREDLHWALDHELWLRMFPRARRTVYLPRTLACATSHAEAKSIRGMRRQIAEIWSVKRSHLASFSIGRTDTLRLLLGQGNLYVYWVAARLGLR